ncbi:hypothetical protein RchiOBHm_Chr2g0160171 [Rosa chinensis]|uniref:Uncharacterized protein n=1 Tax=Rosa chinensis TaxID=74649 RepID=A0A2P6S2G6_ROSCH|nr:hypothetical protein RchiOBHm_Chr2g0160171 [Rosa chinensis]
MMRTVEEAKEKQKPSFELSGNLDAKTNRFKSATLLYLKPAKGRQPHVKWRLYVFKGGEDFNKLIKIEMLPFRKGKKGGIRPYRSPLLQQATYHYTIPASRR